MSEQSDDFRQAIVNALRAHRIECTGPGEVTCSCREGGWMPMSAFIQHQADAVLLLTEVEWMRRNPVHPSMLCWSCKSRNVASTDWDGHGQALAVNPGRNGRFTVRCEDCGAVWEGQLRCVQPSQSGSDKQGGAS